MFKTSEVKISTSYRRLGNLGEIIVALVVWVMQANKRLVHEGPTDGAYVRPDHADPRVPAPGRVDNKTRLVSRFLKGRFV